MKKENYPIYNLFLVLLFLGFTHNYVSAQGRTYATMEVVEVTFNSQRTYSNPYLDVDVWVELQKAGSERETYRIPIFWDGGNVFKARLVATSPGNWRWKVINATVNNSDRGFLNRRGSFRAAAADVSSNPNNRGFIKVNPNTKRTLQYADGTPFFYTADTSWSILTSVFDFNRANDISGISFKNYVRERKKQGFNGINVIASFPDDTYTSLWSRKTWGKKVGPNGETPFEMKSVGGVVNYKKIVPEYWQAVDERMQFLADEGFVTLFESVRRSENWPFRAQDEKNAFYNYIRYLWARYGCYNMIFSWEHHDYDAAVYPKWRALVEHAHRKLSLQLGNRMPYGQPRTAMSFNTSQNNWNKDLPTALDVQNVSNAERDETMHLWLRNIFAATPAKPALNLEPYYAGWGAHSSNDINAGLNDVTMAQMQMYGSVLSGGLAGHAWGDAWYAGAATATGRTPENGGTVVPLNSPQVDALTAFNSQAMGHLKNFILDPGHDYEKLEPAAHTNLSNSRNDLHTLAISNDDNQSFALGFFTADARRNPIALPFLKNLKPSQTYLFEWWDISNGRWICTGNITTTSNGELRPPALPNNDRSKNWAYRIRTIDYVRSIGDHASLNCGLSTALPLRINAGGPQLVHNGLMYVADQNFKGGYSFENKKAKVAKLFQTERTARSAFDYNVPIENGSYSVILHFADIFWGAEGGGTGGSGKRIFDVLIEGNLVLDNFDINADAGAQNEFEKAFDVVVNDGVLDIHFNAVGTDAVDQPKVSAIEILNATEECALPAPWLNGDIGNVAKEGAICYENGEFNLSAGGTDIWGNSDEFHFVYQSLTGDGEIIAQITSLEQANVWTKAAVMMRNDLEANSALAMMSVSPNPSRIGGPGYSFQKRESKGQTMGSSDFTRPVLIPDGFPYYLRLVRSGETFTGYVSQTAGNWNEVGATTIAMNETIYVGLAATSKNIGMLTSAKFKNVRVIRDTEANQAPVAIASANVVSGEAPLAIGFDASSSTDDKAVTSYSWNFKDGATATQENPLHTFTQPGTYDVSLVVSDAEGLTATTTIAINVTEPSTNNFALRINTGGDEIQYRGKTFIADDYFSSGTALDRPQTGLADPFKTFRFSRSKQMSYDIPVPDGEYTVNLYFAELWFGANGGGAGGVGKRVFDVRIEGELAEDDLDVFKEVGAQAMLVKTHTVRVTGGELNIDFDSNEVVNGERHPIINGIEIFKAVDLSASIAKAKIGFVYPSPTTGTFKVSNLARGNKQILVSDFGGRLLINMQTDAEEAELDLSSCTKGVYIVRVFQNGVDQTFKIVKK